MRLCDFMQPKMKAKDRKGSRFRQLQERDLGSIASMDNGQGYQCMAGGMDDVAGRLLFSSRCSRWSGLSSSVIYARSV